MPLRPTGSLFLHSKTTTRADYAKLAGVVLVVELTGRGNGRALDKVGLNQNFPAR